MNTNLCALVIAGYVGIEMNTFLKVHMCATVMACCRFPCLLILVFSQLITFTGTDREYEPFENRLDKLIFVFDEHYYGAR